MHVLGKMLRGKNGCVYWHINYLVKSSRDRFGEWKLRSANEPLAGIELAGHAIYRPRVSLCLKVYSWSMKVLGKQYIMGNPPRVGWEDG